MRYCENCGKIVNDDTSVYCISCGGKIVEDLSKSAAEDATGSMVNLENETAESKVSLSKETEESKVSLSKETEGSKVSLAKEDPSSSASTSAGDNFPSAAQNSTSSSYSSSSSESNTSVGTSSSTYSSYGSYSNSSSYSTYSAPRMTKLGIWGMALSLLALYFNFRFRVEMNYELSRYSSARGTFLAIVISVLIPGLVLSILGMVFCKRGTRRGIVFPIVGIIASAISLIIAFI